MRHQAELWLLHTGADAVGKPGFHSQRLLCAPTPAPASTAASSRCPGLGHPRGRVQAAARDPGGARLGWPHGGLSQVLVVPPELHITLHSIRPASGICEGQPALQPVVSTHKLDCTWLSQVKSQAANLRAGRRYAKSNTSRSIESCGILAGTLDLAADTFSISTLIVPKQEGTSDTVAALGEEEIFEAQDSRSLFPLGWIHTHPSQTCFLSSIDIHTQCGYQVLPSPCFIGCPCACFVM